ncbi:type II toxin-antitoxin system RelE/ParE family toxin [Maribrevibacterium harenarium]|uniref:Type II toxin-antitoxin system RelE/ParE family toxin n=1 Tax=Maribrevibacterium harenarium TaxID=2589817 RepID=A0A501X477_9GAMM|nr:type II toxin-antitoxin system RelE/ParE family toxin [Maribrevibacterium harenarium]TPE55322.1 type II toxin-antitoxin system RelE/ParE family toxin [Maribrevibacterium harenarium]
MKLIYTADAIEDLQRLREFIAVHNPISAKRIATELVTRIELLLDFPQMGTPVQMSPVPDEIRDIVFGKYIVRYSLHCKTIIILRVWHGLENQR